MNKAINPKDAVGRLKPQLHAIPPSALIALGLAMENGEGKYGLMNWRDKAVIASVYYDAAQRHLLSWWDGEDVASDSGIHHLAHVMACCAIMIDAEIASSLSDDRPAGGPAAEMIAHLHQQRTDASLLGAVGEALQPEAPAEPLWPGWPSIYGDSMGLGSRTRPIDWEGAPDLIPVSRPEHKPFWNFFNRKKEPEMATELETIAAAVARSEASSEKTLALVQSFGVKLENIRATTTDANTAAQLLALATSLNAESDKVDAGEAAGEAELPDPVAADPTTPSTPTTVPVTDPTTPVAADPTSSGTPSSQFPPIDPAADPAVPPVITASGAPFDGTNGTATENADYERGLAAAQAGGATVAAADESNSAFHAGYFSFTGTPSAAPVTGTDPVDNPDAAAPTAPVNPES